MSLEPDSPASPLAVITKGKKNKPPRILLHGPEGIGKSTFGANAPSPIFIPTEDGIDEIDVASFPLSTTLRDVTDNLDTLIHNKHEFSTVVVDTADWLERLIHADICNNPPVASMELACGGFGKAYGVALTRWKEILDRLDYLRNVKNMVVILLAHSTTVKVQDPEADSAYDRNVPRLNDSKNSSSLALISEWSDAVFFATQRMRIAKEDLGFKKSRSTAVGIGKDGGERIIRPFRTPATLAKNRYGITEEFPLSWDAFIAAAASSESKQAAK